MRRYVSDLDQIVHVVYIPQTSQGTSGWTCCNEQFTHPGLPYANVSMMIVVHKPPTCLRCIVKEQVWAKDGAIPGGLW